MSDPKPYTREEIEAFRADEGGFFTLRLDRLLATVDARDAEIARLNVHLSNVSGALVDASTVKVGDEKSYADGIRALTEERNRLRELLREAMEVVQEVANPTWGVDHTVADELLAKLTHELAKPTKA